MPKFTISPSILSANFAHLSDDITNVLQAGADMIHFDVMDNHYVPNLTIGAMVCQALRDDGISAPIDVHLMVSPVDSLINSFAKAGASRISIHPEATNNLEQSLELIRQHNVLAGIAFNPETSLSYLEEMLDKIDYILLMSVNPGFGGQKFIPETIQKISQAYDFIQKNNLDLSIQVDGGINIDNIKSIAQAGADNFVAGSAIFHSNNYQDTINQMRAELILN